MNTAMRNLAILPICYLPPVQYFVKLLQYRSVLLEAAEHYTKQTYRNRCVILGANGPIPLTIPVIKTQGNHTPIRLVEIDNSTLWQKNHWKTIESAYRTSAYYDFVADVLAPFYAKRFTNLFEFNCLLLEAIFDFLSLRPSITPTTHYAPGYGADFRTSISPKCDFSLDTEFVAAEYFQVFSARFGFIPNLSIADLLFNEGLSAVEVVTASIKPAT